MQNKMEKFLINFKLSLNDKFKYLNKKKEPKPIAKYDSNVTRKNDCLFIKNEKHTDPIIINQSMPINCLFLHTSALLFIYVQIMIPKPKRTIGVPVNLLNQSISLKLTIRKMQLNNYSYMTIPQEIYLTSSYE